LVASAFNILVNQQPSITMKKTLLVVILLILVCAAWVILRQPKSPPPSIPIPPTNNVSPYSGRSTPTTNAQVPSQPSAVLFSAPSTNVPVRPASVDEETWSRWLAYRQFILEQNPPVEFYARVVDQSGQPVEGAKLTLKLTRMEGMAFATTNFSAWDPAKAIQDTSLDLYSDAKGWIKLSGVTGRDLRVETLKKDGYSWTMPQIDSFAYESNGERTVGYAEMRDAFNPDKGYVFHLTKN
jgi:hypothetical protein